MMLTWYGFLLSFLSALLIYPTDMGEPLDTNKELNTVGWSNILSGLTGGFTGRYGTGRHGTFPNRQQYPHQINSGMSVHFGWFTMQTDFDLICSAHPRGCDRPPHFLWSGQRKPEQHR